MFISLTESTLLKRFIIKNKIIIKQINVIWKKTSYGAISD